MTLSRALCLPTSSRMTTISPFELKRALACNPPVFLNVVCAAEKLSGYIEIYNENMLLGFFISEKSIITNSIRHLTQNRL